MRGECIRAFHAIEELLRKSGKDELKGVFLFSKDSARIKAIAELSEAKNVKTRRVSEEEMEKLCKNDENRGALLLLESSSLSNVSDFDTWLSEISESKSTQPCTVLILDSVTDEGNLGAILRSAEQFSADLVILPERRGATSVGSEAVLKSSAGAAAWVRVSIVKNLSRAVKRLKEEGFWIYGADMAGEPLTAYEFPQKSAIVMGSEGKGISRLLKEECDATLFIPTSGKIDSLNVSVAAGIFLYERSRSSFLASLKEKSK